MQLVCHTVSMKHSQSASQRTVPTLGTGSRAAICVCILRFSNKATDGVIDGDLVHAGTACHRATHTRRSAASRAHWKPRRRLRVVRSSHTGTCRAKYHSMKPSGAARAPSKQARAAFVMVQADARRWVSLLETQQTRGRC